MTQQYDDLKTAQDELLRGSATETKKLLNQLQTTQSDLQKREDQLNQLSRSVDEKKRKKAATAMAKDPIKIPTKKIEDKPM